MNEQLYWANSKVNSVSQVPLAESGSMDLIVIDDFLEQPLLVRDEILALDFEPPPDPKKGVISFNAPIPSVLQNVLSHQIERVLEASVLFHPRSKCALTVGHIPLNSVCHVDGGDGMCMFNWTVVVYLNLPAQCSGGTNFFRHRPTGDIYNRRGNAFYAQDYLDAERWELIESVDMKFNRAVFCPAWRFHSIAHTFGSAKEDARLTLNPKIIAHKNQDSSGIQT